VPTIPEDVSSVVARISDVVKTTSWHAVFAKNDAEFDKLIDEMASKAEALGLKKVLDWDADAWKQAQEIANKYK
jgi:hypothetical protein